MDEYDFDQDELYYPIDMPIEEQRSLGLTFEPIGFAGERMTDENGKCVIGLCHCADCAMNEEFLAELKKQ